MKVQDIHKHAPISNIQNMQRAIGVTVSSFDTLYAMEYDNLHEMQNGLIEHYNNAVNNMKR
ncbi:MAG: hypothetical protein Unbinned4388contig1000_69 [Prokaryotic dsDNA virus sp.]|nr:MAG: hypothetical protein Unbinned4388contig1000_69 [Prokaryotic dsDNA virus sp.]|tara:strand:- start:1832 stop:2014 length:183 start_codon:yes stop_codon:yes gene_type:complete